MARVDGGSSVAGRRVGRGSIAGSQRFCSTDRRVFEPPLTIGVVADTHVHANGARRLPGEVPALFARVGAGLILHAGDVNTVSVLRELGQAAPVLAVAGNNDDPDLLAVLPEALEFVVGRFRFALLHGHGGRSARSEAARRYGGRVDCAVYGHSHIPKLEIADGTIFFNPGSPIDRRWQPHFGVGLIRVTMDKIEPDLILFDDPRHLGNVITGGLGFRVAE